ncbi:transcriptional regulator [Jeotgalibacillus sp. S-D1]|uniref:transcriptional regulator n=1 Tax=Jeotgalibacillus sp. S-D1 TaxID=2552189 RepID=UPI00105AA599|nr:transcriptional regulator [Jeotgalibacillus sp. S-D1]TDL30802.1 transcriptional regulator [Jeotgalibacillus sp. S-D1]
MSINIAVIGSKEFIDQIKSAASELSNIRIDPYIYKKPQDTAEIIRKVKSCDVLFFSGALPYYFSKAVRENLPIPSLYLVTDEFTISSTLLSISYNRKISLDRISIDHIDSSVVNNVFNEIDIRFNHEQFLNFSPMLEKNQFDLMSIVNFHLSLWKQGKVDLALTSIHAVYDRLQALGVPAIRLTETKKILISGLNNAKKQAELHKRKASQVAAGYISADLTQEQIRAFAHHIHASFQQIDEGMTVFYSTRGEIETLMEQDFLRNFMSNYTSFLFGFGYGATIKEAEQNAKIALTFSESEEAAKYGYILTEEKELLGPLPHINKQVHLKNDHAHLFEIAKQTKLSPANLSKVIQFSSSRQDLHFTAKDLAEYLQITRRSTERIIKRLLDNGYLKVVGEEMTYQKGRPRAIYQLNIPIYF